MMLYLRESMAGAWHRLLMLDRALLLWARQCEKRWLTKWMLTATKLGDSTTYVALGLVLLSMGPAVRKVASLLACAAIMAPLSALLVKKMFRRDRPRVAIGGFSPLVSIPDPYSFPSGHTATAMAVAVALLPEGNLLGALGLFHAANVGISRVYLGAHYPLDVAAGAVLGTGVGLSVRFMLLPF
jgi:undecaprenyl-diphosphatase